MLNLRAERSEPYCLGSDLANIQSASHLRGAKHIAHTAAGWLGPDLVNIRAAGSEPYWLGSDLANIQSAERSETHCPYTPIGRNKHTAPGERSGSLTAANAHIVAGGQHSQRGAISRQKFLYTLRGAGTGWDLVEFQPRLGQLSVSREERNTLPIRRPGGCRQTVGEKSPYNIPHRGNDAAVS